MVRNHENLPTSMAVTNDQEFHLIVSRVEYFGLIDMCNRIAGLYGGHKTNRPINANVPNRQTNGFWTNEMVD